MFHIQIKFTFWPAADYYICKRFTYVAKTCANLTTYSRKPENYNGTIIFEIDIVKKSSLTKIWIDWGRVFHDINLKNNGAIVILRFSTICG